MYTRQVKVLACEFLLLTGGQLMNAGKLPAENSEEVFIERDFESAILLSAMNNSGFSLMAEASGCPPDANIVSK